MVENDGAEILYSRYGYKLKVDWEYGLVLDDDVGTETWDSFTIEVAIQASELKLSKLNDFVDGRNQGSLTINVAVDAS